MRRRKRTLEEHLKNYVVNENGCHIWQGYVEKSCGYGYIRLRGANRRIHKLVYELHHNVKVNRFFHIDHLCRNKLCINVEHLEKVTPQVNTLRGEGPASINAKKTHCINGHELTKQNTYIYKDRRVCRTCAVSRTKEWRKFAL